MRMPFSGPNWPICPEQIFLAQTIIITFIYLLAPLIVQIKKKILPRIQSYEDALFLGPKWCQKSDINLLLNYWWLKNTEISLAECHFWL